MIALYPDMKEVMYIIITIKHSLFLGTHFNKIANNHRLTYYRYINN